MWSRGEVHWAPASLVLVADHLPMDHHEVGVAAPVHLGTMWLKRRLSPREKAQRHVDAWVQVVAMAVARVPTGQCAVDT